MDGTAAPKTERRILVVDGNLHSREGLSASLRSDGNSIETAPDGWEAIRKIKVARYDIAIIDLDLPPIQGVGVTGWDLARIFRAYNPSSAIIAVSAEVEKAQEVQARLLGISELLEKPISPARLRAIVRALGHPAEVHSAACCTAPP